MEFNLKKGLKGKEKITVENKDTAVAFGSGGVEVLATPIMIGLMEGAAKAAVEPRLPSEYKTVGTLVDVKHLAATPVGMEAWAEAELIEVDGRRLVFKVVAYDEKEKIGEGIHERFIINLQKFMEKNETKKRS